MQDRGDLHRPIDTAVDVLVHDDDRIALADLVKRFGIVIVPGADCFRLETGFNDFLDEFLFEGVMQIFRE